MGKKFVFSVFLLFSVLFSCAQDPNEQNLTVTNLAGVVADHIEVDALGNLYVISDAALFKYSLNGELLSTYSNKMLGTIYSVSVANPQKVMLFYRNTESLIFLDDQLNPITEAISLPEKNWQYITLAAFTADNHIWLWDNTNVRMAKLDVNFKEQQVVRYDFKDLQPTQLLPLADNGLVMHDPSGVFFFDSFGTLLKMLPFKTAFDIQIVDQWLYYMKNGNLHNFNYKGLGENFTYLPFYDVIQAQVYRNAKALLREGGKVSILQ